MVAQETHDLGVLPFEGGASVGQISRPVLEGGVIFVGCAPFVGYSPTVVGNHLRELAGFPGVLVAGGSIAPDIHVDEVQIVADLFLKLAEPALAGA